MKKIVSIAVVSAFMVSAFTAIPSVSQASDAAAMQMEAAGIMKGFGGKLKGTLVGAMKAGGPINAIGACNDKAPGIADQASANGWDVGRTALKLRNAGNQADEWELKVLNMFEARKAAGQNPGKIQFSEVVDLNGKKEFRFMKAIPTGEVCVSCHGANLKPEVAAKLDELYPTDEARGFSKGDIRGAFTLRKSL